MRKRLTYLLSVDSSRKADDVELMLIGAAGTERLWGGPHEFYDWYVPECPEYRDLSEETYRLRMVSATDSELAAGTSSGYFPLDDLRADLVLEAGAFLDDLVSEIDSLRRRKATVTRYPVLFGSGAWRGLAHYKSWNSITSDLERVATGAVYCPLQLIAAACSDIAGIRMCALMAVEAQLVRVIKRTLGTPDYEEKCVSWLKLWCLLAVQLFGSRYLEDVFRIAARRPRKGESVSSADDWFPELQRLRLSLWGGVPAKWSRRGVGLNPPVDPEAGVLFRTSSGSYRYNRLSAPGWRTGLEECEDLDDCDECGRSEEGPLTPPDTAVETPCFGCGDYVHSVEYCDACIA